MMNKTFSLSGFSLKLIAVVTMIIDHAGAFLFPEIIAFRVIGRLSFPIFAYFVCEGMEHTKDSKKYILRLLAFALITEPFWDLAVNGSFFSFYGGQNVIFTFLIGAVTIYVCEKEGTWIWGMIGMVAAQLLSTDYSAFGVFLIIMLWYQRKEKWQLVLSVSTFAIGVCMFQMFDFIAAGIKGAFFLQSMLQMVSILSVFPLFLYDGTRGGDKLNKNFVKYFFYGVYPLQFLIFAILRNILL